jgi:Na+-transporting NADH:ubiquinone oxidoreductase subunit A
VSRHRIRRGLSLPLSGEPEQRIETAREPERVALVGRDRPGLGPRVLVEPGEVVERGQPLLEDRHRPHVHHASPASGVVESVNRGARRRLLSVVVRRDADDVAGRPHGRTMDAFPGEPVSPGDALRVRALLLESGLWAGLVERPYGRAPSPTRRPRSIVVAAMDSHPLAPDPAVVLAGQERAFADGLAALTTLTDGPVFACVRAGGGVAVPRLQRVRVEEFDGPHPAGTPGLAIHLLDPVDRDRRVWQVGYQDVVAIGRLLRTGVLSVERVVALAGPGVRRPRLLRTRLGASVGDLVEGELEDGSWRVVAGSVLDGRTADGPVLGYLARDHRQVTVLREDRRRELVGWLRPGLDLFSVTGSVAGAFRRRPRDLGTSRHGSGRAIVPLGTYERVLPFDLLPTALLKALASDDLERAEELGCLELLEEDLAPCTFACPGKIDHGANLRRVLDALEKGG